MESVKRLKIATADYPVTVAIGGSLAVAGSLYNALYIIGAGRIHGIVVSDCPANTDRQRIYAAGSDAPATVDLDGEPVPCGTDLLFTAGDARVAFIMDRLTGVPNPETMQRMAAADIIFHADDEPVRLGMPERRMAAIAHRSAALHAAYVYQAPGNGESSTDAYYDAGALIAVSGKILRSAANPPDGRQQIAMPVQTAALWGMTDARRAVHTGRIISLPLSSDARGVYDFKPSRTPWIPDNLSSAAVCEQTMNIQVNALKQRMRAIGFRKAIIGISGGLDSAMALLVTERAMREMGLTAADIITVTMPCFGTSNRTLEQANRLMASFGTTTMTVDIGDAVRRHLKDIGHDGRTTDVAYENAQARERTQVLMDLANMHQAPVIGTGDFSEAALGFCTYNGDHMSNYAVNIGVPKTLMREIIGAHVAAHPVLGDILATPVSPELIPGEAGEITQVTEDLVGPYDLQDFLIYHTLRYGMASEELIFTATRAFEGDYTENEVREWAAKMMQRLITSQFKRSCSVDGPAVIDVSLSPRGGLVMPSDMDRESW